MPSLPRFAPIHRPALLALTALLPGCGLLGPDSRRFEEPRYYGGSASADPELGGYMATFCPNGQVDFTRGSDIAERGTYRIRGDQIVVNAEQPIRYRLAPDEETITERRWGEQLTRRREYEASLFCT